MTFAVAVDAREPWPHPWAAHWPADTRVQRGTLETGDVCLAALPEGAVSKGAGDLSTAAGALGGAFDPLLAAFSGYHEGVAENVDALTGLVGGLLGGLQSQAGNLANLERRLTNFINGQ